MATDRSTTVIVFPFDNFGGNGTAEGAEVLGEMVSELLDDLDQEQRPARTDVYQGRVHLKEIPFKSAKALANWQSVGRQIVKQALKSGENLLWLGGNHLSVLPVYEELGASKKASATLVLQFDAHLDIQQWHDVNVNPTNGNFLLHADESLPNIINVGHRDLLLTRKEITQYYLATHSALDLAQHENRIQDEVLTRVTKAERIWIDIDVDVFDPAEQPGIMVPAPFGPSRLTLLKLLDTAFQGNVIGVSISEYLPSRDTHQHGLYLLGWLIEWLLLRWYEPTQAEADLD